MPPRVGRSLKYIKSVGSKSPEPLNFVISERGIEKKSVVSLLGYQEKQKATCNIREFFKKRYFQVKFTDGFIGKYPIADPSKVADLALKIQALDDVICVNYFGERWPTILGLGNPSIKVARPKAKDIEVISGIIDYGSTSAGRNLGIKVKFEDKPTNLKTAIESCTGKISETIVPDAAPPGFSSRRAIGKIPIQKSKSFLTREAPIANESDINKCLEGFSKVCGSVGFEGEIFLNIGVYLMNAATKNKLAK